jgi:hypothetical protein
MTRRDDEMVSPIFAGPHCVRIDVPDLGFGSDLDAMIQFCWERSEELRTGYLGTRTNPRDWIFFCFSDAKNAQDFARRFNGKILSPVEVSVLFSENGAGV